jgi:hypothetical protein
VQQTKWFVTNIIPSYINNNLELGSIHSGVVSADAFKTPPKGGMASVQPGSNTSSNSTMPPQSDNNTTPTTSNATDDCIPVPVVSQFDKAADSFEMITICTVKSSFDRFCSHALKKLPPESVGKSNCSLCSSVKAEDKVVIMCSREGPTQQSSWGNCSFKLCAACYRGILKNNEHYENAVLPASDCEEFEEESEIDMVEEGTKKTVAADALNLVATYETPGSNKGSKYAWVSPYVQTAQGTPTMMKYYPQVSTCVCKPVIFF